ncbi:UPF0175 family protein [Parapedobacter soli]|uniref:UPF0175 family protein n=1 Tax=Parapedobacter soli TaxID=416955 RepID=UPI0021CAA2B9|nr:UPF0175 family protein [Parapedobacter soli]
MNTLTLKVPASLEKDRQNTVRFIAAKLYESDKLTLGQAAQMAGMKKWDFAEILVDYGIHYLEPALREDLEIVERGRK